MQMKCHTPKSIMTILTFLSIACIIAGCPNNTMSEEELAEQFSQAVEHSKTLGSDNIYRYLSAVTSYNDELQWEGVPGESRVKVVTWTSYEGYEIGKSYSTQWVHKYQPTRDLWVTLVPQLQTFVTKEHIRDDRLELRLKQLLGMPHDTERKYFVEFWVQPADLFRPSPDPEVTDHAAELDFPPDTLFMTISDSHKDWINWQRQYNDWPWTGLGYTYDWGNPLCIVGLSEYVIRANAEITVISIVPTNEYFNR